MLPPPPAVHAAVTTLARRTLTAGDSNPGRRRARRLFPTLLTAGVLLALWGIFTLGWYSAVVAAIAATAAAAIVLARRRPDAASAVATALITSAAPLILIAVGADNSRPLADITPLLIFSFAGPLPTLAAWMCRPLTSRSLNALLGSGSLLAGTAVQWFLGAAGSWVLYTALLTALSVIAVRYGRALRRTLAQFSTDNAGWTDLGRRALTPGSTLQLLIGHGRAVAVFTHDDTPAPTAAQLQGYVIAATGLADRLMLAPARVQPVVIQAGAGTDWRREMVNDGVAASAVPIAGPAALPAICAAFAAAHRAPAARARLLRRRLDQRLIRRATAVTQVV